MVTREALLTVAPKAEPYANQLLTQMFRRHISDNDNRAAAFLGQIYVESAGFTKVVESLNYASHRLTELFSRDRISEAQALQYGRTPQHPADQRELGNILYGGEWGRKNLGNTDPYDGWRFRGRGLKQLTGRANYTEFSNWWFGDNRAVQDPDIVAMPHGAVASAIWFWVDANQDRDINRHADAGDVKAVTKIVNGGYTALPERIRWTQKFLDAFRAVH